MGELDERCDVVAEVAVAEEVVALEDVPAEVRAPTDAVSPCPAAGEVDLLELALSDVADPQIARGAIEREPPRISEPVRPDLVATGAVDERVARRNRVRLAVRGRDRADPQDLPQQGGDRLAVAPARVAVAFVVGAPAVAEPDVERAVRAEGDLAAVVICLWLLTFKITRRPSTRAAPFTNGYSSMRVSPWRLVKLT